MGARTFRELRAWQVARAFKLSIYRLTGSGPLARDERLCSQMREAAASAASQISEGFGRFDPADFARFVKMGRASIVECQNHLDDAVDRGYLSEDGKRTLDDEARRVLSEAAGLLDYLQSPEARTRAEQVKLRRFERRASRRGRENS